MQTGRYFTVRCYIPINTKAWQKKCRRAGTTILRGGPCAMILRIP